MDNAEKLLVDEGLISKVETEPTIGEFKRRKLEEEAQKNWDRFYRRNSDHFFKDRNWTKSEIEQLFGGDELDILENPLAMLEAGCGCGNTIFPLTKFFPNWHFWGVDFSQNALALLRRRAHQLAVTVHTLVADLTAVNFLQSTPIGSLPKADLVSLIFVLSSISSDHHLAVIRNLRAMLAPMGNVIFRDYGIFDHAMLRFNKRSKISDRFYVRQDGTRAHYFHKEEVSNLFESCGFKTVKCAYVRRKTTNIKEGISIDRVFVEGRFKLVDEE